MQTHSPSDRERTLVRLVERYEADLLRLCCISLCDAQLAQDAVQETFYKAYRQLHRFRGESSEKTWLTRIAINTCRDMRRQGWFRFVDRSITPESLPEPLCPCAQEQSDLVMDVMRLPAASREVILLYYYQDMTMKEISQALHIPQRTVSYRLKKAREALRIELEKEAGT